MQSGTNPASSSESEMISFEDIGVSSILGGVQWEIHKAIGDELCQKSADRKKTLSG